MIISQRRSSSVSAKSGNLLPHAENLRIQNQDLSRSDTDWLIGARRKAQSAVGRPEMCQTDSMSARNDTEKTRAVGFRL
jgi:hypothetical protein